MGSEVGKLFDRLLAGDSPRQGTEADCFAEMVADYRREGCSREEAISRAMQRLSNDAKEVKRER